MTSTGVTLLTVAVLLAVASGELFAVQYGYGTADCSGEVFSVTARSTSAAAPCVPAGCSASGGSSSYVSCSAALPVPSSKMTCGFDQFATTGCLGHVTLRQRVALGVCVGVGGASVQYTDCDLSGKPLTFVQYSDTLCRSPTTGGSVAAPVAGRTCLGGTCSLGTTTFLCNAVLPNTPPQTCFSSPDLNSDGNVDLLDIVILLNSWGTCTTDFRCYQSDQNCDGVINLLDVSIVINSWTA